VHAHAPPINPNSTTIRKSNRHRQPAMTDSVKIKQLRRAFSVRWRRTLYIMFFAQLTTAVGFSSIFPFLPLYVKSLGSYTGLSIELLSGLVFSGQAFTMMLASPIWGALADRYGRKLMVERSMFGGFMLLLLMAFVTNAEQLIILRTVQGMITGTLAAANALVASQAPRDRTGYAMGLLQVGMGTGVAVGPLIGGAIADAYGYSAAFYVTAALLLLSGFMVLIGVEEDFKREESTTKKEDSLVAEWRRVISSQGVPITYGMRFLTQLGRMMILPIAPLFIASLLTDAEKLNTFTGLVIGSASATTTLSAGYLGRLGDRIGHRKVVISSTLAAAALFLPQSFITEAWHMFPLQALVGVALGGVIPAISALLARYTESGEEGAVYGLDNSINAGARALAPLAGAMVASWLGLRATFIATAAIFLLTSAVAARYLPAIHPLPESAA
jgi:DHA1 family multidrug resistance protein-like MFS transporter